MLDLLVLLLLPLPALSAATAASSTSPSPARNYDGHQIFRVPVYDNGAFVRSVLDRLRADKDNENDVYVWQPPAKKGTYADVGVAPRLVKPFLAAMNGQELTIMHEDLGRSIREEGNFDFYAAGSANETWFRSYHFYADHLTWMNDMASEYCENANIVTSGKTLEGHDITGLHIFGKSGGGEKPAIILHGTVHAREWIVAMVVEYMANQLLANYGTDQELTAFVDKYDFYIFPIINVDGFKYSQTTDRMWRKNRQTTPGSNCMGHDINRNWPFQWNIRDGASDDPCNDAFRGQSAGDAPETKSISAFLHNIKGKQGLKLFIDYHSYSQLFMTPYAYDCNVRHPNDSENQALAKGAVDAIRAVHGTQFKYGSVCKTIYPASGSSIDYVSDVVKADYTFAAELRDTGAAGFVLPPAQILPSGEETFAGFRYLLQNMK